MQFIENIIIGCGPAALQCAYYFEKYKINYIILEKNSICGSFFDKYPLSETLISINKKYVTSNDPDFKLRHDWNSLLNDEQMNFSDYDDDYYPNSNNYVKYLNDFAKKNNIKIKFNTEVRQINKKNDKYEIYIKNEKDYYICDKLIVATGLSLPNIPNIGMNVKNKVKHYCDFPKGFLKNKNELKKEFENKKVLIIGAGNSAFEIATVLNDENITKSIIMITQNVPTFSFVTHYSGNIRSKYLSYLDTFFLKSLNGMSSHTDLNRISIEQPEENGVYKIIKTNNLPCGTVNSPVMENYDKIIFCTGWKFDNSIFDFTVDLTINNKYPDTNLKYESTNNNNLFFIGSLMHTHDYRVSSGGFIHGFRYLIKYFIEKNYTLRHETKHFELNTEEDIKKLSQYIVHRINTSSNMYQMFGFLCDIIVYNKETKQLVYYHNISKKYTFNKSNDPVIYLKISLGYGKQVTDMNIIHRAHGNNLGSEYNAHLIHAIIDILDNIQTLDTIYFSEEIIANFTNPLRFEEKIFRIIKSIH
jgi:hypothetical protein